jgi:hypothetical protein
MGKWMCVCKRKEREEKRGEEGGEERRGGL